MNMIFRCSRLLGVVACLTWGTAFAPAQNPYVPYPGYHPGYYPGYPGGYYPGAVGGALQGQAAVINATGELGIQQEQARQERQKWEQMKLETKKKSFDELMYEKANTPTLTEDLQYEGGLTLQRMMTSPTPAEITSGKTLNAMMPMISKLSYRGTQGPSMSIDQDLLRNVNVTVGKDGASIGMLTGGGAKLDWPLCLQGPKQKKVAGQIPTAVSQARMGQLDAKLYREITTQISDINEELRKRFHKEEIDGGEFLEGRRFLDSLTQSIQALRSPTSNRFLDGTYTAKGNTVPDLANNMTKSGLSFTACNPGEEASYYALHDMFVAYTQSAQAAAGFQVRYNPPRTDPWKVTQPQVK